jgi:hypothetical protein
MIVARTNVYAPAVLRELLCDNPLVQVQVMFKKDNNILALSTPLTLI